MPYNATLCKEAWGKKITGASCEAYVFFLKTVPVIFLLHREDLALRLKLHFIFIVYLNLLFEYLKVF